MEITYELTEEDYIAFNLYHMENSPSQKRMYNLSRYLLPLISSGLIYIIGTSVFRQPELYWLFIALLFWVVWVAFYPKQYKKAMRKQLRKMMSEGDNSSIIGKKTLKMEEDKLIIYGEHATEIISKNTIQTVKVYEDMVLLYLSAVSAQIIPTRGLSEADRAYLTNINN